MNVSKKMLFTGAAVTVMGLAAGGAALVSADSSSTSTDGKTSLVDKIASTFGLDKTKVQAVFDQNRQEHEAAQTTKVTADLDKLVSSGKITSAQEKLILDKRTELQTQREANRDSMQSKTDAERKAAREAERTSLEQWAKDNGISTDYLRYVVGGPHGMGMHGPDASADDSSTSATTTN